VTLLVAGITKNRTLRDLIDELLQRVTAHLGYLPQLGARVHVVMEEHPLVDSAIVTPLGGPQNIEVAHEPSSLPVWMGGLVGGFACAYLVPMGCPVSGLLDAYLVTVGIPVLGKVRLHIR